MSSSKRIAGLTGSEIAIIGMAGRFPGANSIDELWNNLRNGVESITFFTNEQLQASGVKPEALDDPNYVKARPVLEDVELFDAAFFGFTPREAEITDPQHRLFLECVWEAIENAGYDPESYKGAISVFGGASSSSYLINNLYANPEAMALAGSLQTSISNSEDSLTTRIAYKLNLKGPCYAIQTFCSTSLVTVHVACQNLLNFECDMAIAGGVSIYVPQNTGYWYEKGNIFSSDGHCRPFDAKAKGMVFGNGLGAVVLRRLEDSLADGDHIDAVIIGSATNNDGSLKVSYTAPSVTGQAEVIVEALANSDVNPETITYVETHGTGTALGDPAEITALTRAFRSGTQNNGFCAIGSVKSNIGHLDRAAGVASLIKTVLALKNRAIPPTLHFETPNPEIDFENSPFYVNNRLSKWKSGGAPRRAGVSSFGVGGTNAHVIVEESPEIEPSGPSRPGQLLLLSAKTKSALEVAAANLCEYLTKHAALNIADVAYTLQTGRKAFNHRRFTVCDSATDAVQTLKSLDPQWVKTRYIESRDPEIVFMFPGQGAQYVNMGLNLYEHELLFRQIVDQCAEILRPFLDRDLCELLYPKGSDLEPAAELLRKTGFQQPAIFTIEYALAKLWKKWGICPAAMIGHSIGEYVAACLADVFSLEDALMLVATRGRMMQELPGGAMLSIRLPATEVESKLDDRLSLAAINAPLLCVVSGPTEAVRLLQVELEKENVVCRFLHTSHAFHSPMMDSIVEPFAEHVKAVKLSPPNIPFVSAATGMWIADSQATDPMYWGRQLRVTVRFAEGIETLWERPERVLLEVGPRTTCSTLARQQAKDNAKQAVISSLGDTADADAEWMAILGAMGHLWLAGVPIDWENFYDRETRHRVALPTYPFERKRFWVEPARHVAGTGSLSDVTEQPAQAHDLDRIVQQSTEQFAPDKFSEDEYDAPLTQAEVLLAAVWKEVLGVDRIGVDDNFSSDLGGDSLSVVQMIEIIRKKLGVRLDPNIFALNTLRQIAPYLEGKPSLTETKGLAEQVDSNYYVTEVSSEEDLAQAISIWERNLPVPVGTGMEKYHWFYETNPYQKSKLHLLRLKGNEKAVGVGGIGYRNFSVRGKPLMGVIGVDFAVDKDHRALGPALKLQRTVMESTEMDADFRYGFPSKQAEVILKYYGYEKIAEFTRLVKVLRSGNYLKKVVKPRFLAGAISIPADFLLRLKSMNTLWASGNVFQSDNLESSHHLVDRLWDQITQQNLLMGERNLDYLNWRYFKCPTYKHKVFGVRDKDNALQGVMVYLLQNKRVEIVDLICPDYEDTTIIHSLLINFEKYCFSIPVDSIEINIIGSKKITRHLLSMGYSHRKDRTSSVFIEAGQNKDLLAQFKDINNSLWFGGDLQ